MAISEKRPPTPQESRESNRKYAYHLPSLYQILLCSHLPEVHRDVGIKIQRVSELLLALEPVFDKLQPRDTINDGRPGTFVGIDLAGVHGIEDAYGTNAFVYKDWMGHVDILMVGPDLGNPDFMRQRTLGVKFSDEYRTGKKDHFANPPEWYYAHIDELIPALEELLNKAQA